MTDRTVQAPQTGRDKSFSQIVFVTGALVIIIGGLWMLYMGDAPYHPEVTQQATGIGLISD